MPAARKDVLPERMHCNSRYLSGTSERLQQMMKQHVPETALQ